MMMSAPSSPPPSPPALPLDMGHAQRSVASSRRLFVIFALILCSCGVGLVSVSTLLQGSDVLRSSAISLNGKAASTQLAAQGQGLRRGGSPISAYTSAAPVVPPASPSDPAPTTSTIKLPVNERWSRLGNLDDYECVAWRPTADCSPLGAVDMNRSSSCSESIVNGVSGYCEIRHKSSKKTHKIMEMYCDSLRPGVSFRCQDFAQVLNYGRRAPQYVHDTGFSFNTCRQSFLEDQKAVNSAPVPIDAATRPDQFFKQGIAIVVYEKLLESVYASIKSLRQQGCSLPIELWYLSSETDTNHPILRTLTRDFGAYLREITDPRASRFYTKTYAVFYSAFDQVLLLDADNFAVRDPTYLFSTKEFVDTGAIFWPDFWRFKKTIFNIQPTSFVWDVFDLDPVDMFEQESGQVLVDRRRHFAAMNVMMYYSFHPQLIESMRLVWGDKDLFRFAWMKTKSSFHMIKMPPGAAGVKLADRNVFCGVTMVQHDTKHEVLFLHRNQEKLTSENKRVVWQDLQQFKINSVPMDEYDVRGANGGRYYPMFKRCYGKDIYYEKAFTVRPVAELPFAGLEARLLDFVTEAGRIINGTASTQ